MPFTEHIAAIPYTSTTNRGAGLLAPMMRAMGHILYLAGCMADTAITVTNEQATRELTDAKEHWDARTGTEAVSSTTAGIIEHISQALTDAIAEYSSWTDQQRSTNIRDLANRMVFVGAKLDREAIGITGSDPGSSL